MEIWARHEWGVTTSIWVLGNHHVSLEYHFVCVEEICKSIIRAHFHIMSTDARRLPRTHMLEVIVVVKFGILKLCLPLELFMEDILQYSRWKRKPDINDPTMEIWARYEWGVTTHTWVLGNHHMSLEYHSVCVKEICKSIIRAYLSLYSVIGDFFMILRLLKDMVFQIKNKKNTQIYSMWLNKVIFMGNTEPIWHKYMSSQQEIELGIKSFAFILRLSNVSNQRT